MVTSTVTDLDRNTAVGVVVIAVLMAAAAAAVVWRYSRGRAREVRSTGRGLLLWHVIAIAVGLCGLWFVLALGQLDTTLDALHTPRWARSLGYFACGVVQLAALVIMGARLGRPASTNERSER